MDLDFSPLCPNPALGGFIICNQAEDPFKTLIADLFHDSALRLVGVSDRVLPYFGQ